MPTWISEMSHGIGSEVFSKDTDKHLILLFPISQQITHEFCDSFHTCGVLHNWFVQKVWCGNYWTFMPKDCTQLRLRWKWSLIKKFNGQSFHGKCK
jgi:hypothetical protein